ncbi:hypothetical protein ABTA75_18960, partial [Acinetobacter baumannii]
TTSWHIAQFSGLTRHLRHTRAQAEAAAQDAAAAAELETAQAALAALPDPATGRAALDAARAHNEAARRAMQHAAAALSTADQAIAVGRERI